MAMTSGDKQIVYNLRQRWKEELSHISDEQLAEEYRHFAQSSYYGNNDERFLDWLFIDNNGDNS